MNGYMFDTNIFNRILDGQVEIDSWADKAQFFVTHIQWDELNATRNLSRKGKLIRVFQTIAPSNVPTESSVLDVSRLDMAKLGVEDNLYEKVKRDLDAMKRKPNNCQDALIAETAIMNGFTLVTDDKDLLQVTQSHAGAAKSFSGFIEELGEE